MAVSQSCTAQGPCDLSVDAGRNVGKRIAKVVNLKLLNAIVIVFCMPCKLRLPVFYGFFLGLFLFGIALTRVVDGLKAIVKAVAINDQGNRVKKFVTKF